MHHVPRRSHDLSRHRTQRVGPGRRRSRRARPRSTAAAGGWTLACPGRGGDGHGRARGALGHGARGRPRCDGGGDGRNAPNRPLHEPAQAGLGAVADQPRRGPGCGPGQQRNAAAAAPGGRVLRADRRGLRHHLRQRRPSLRLPAADPSGRRGTRPWLRRGRLAQPGPRHEGPHRAFRPGRHAHRSGRLCQGPRGRQRRGHPCPPRRPSRLCVRRRRQSRDRRPPRPALDDCHPPPSPARRGGRGAAARRRGDLDLWRLRALLRARRCSLPPPARSAHRSLADRRAQRDDPGRRRSDGRGAFEGRVRAGRERRHATDRYPAGGGRRGDRRRRCPALLVRPARRPPADHRATVS